jgi:multidrug efflux pump
MNLSAPFIKRPTATTLLAIGLAIAGSVAFKLLPVASLPQIDFPTITVSAGLPGGSPETMATSVATPLERQIGRIAGITQITSSSTLGATNITVQFDLARNIDGAARDIQAAINAARGQLPINLPNNPTYRKVNPADSPILILALTSDINSQGQIYDAASTVFAQTLSQVNGVGQVIVGGSSLPAVRIELNPTTLNKYGIGLNEVSTAIAAANVNKPKGHLNTDITTSTILANDQLHTAAEYQPLIIRYQNGNPVRLSDVATVTDSVENVRNAGLADGKPSVLMVLFKQPGANVIETVDNIIKELPRLTAAIPATMNVSIAMDRTSTIRASLHDVEMTLVIAIILVIFVVYLFLGNFRAMLIPSVAVPLSLLGTFGVMYLLGYTLDNLSLMALTISTGFVVDDAVVVLENITRHMEDGMDRMRAAFQGAKEVGFTVVSMSLSLIAVFIPILLMGGLVGRLFREFAITLSTAILISLLISLTVTPTMCAYLLKKPSHKKISYFQKLLNWSHTHYENSLKWALKHHILMLLLTLGAIVLTVILFIIVPKGFFPQQDTGRIQASLQADQNISFQFMQQKLTAFVDIVRADPAVEHVVGFVGGAGGSTTNSGTVFITLKPLSERKISAEKIINRLRKNLSAVTGATLFMQAAQDLVVGGRLGNAQYQYTLSADSIAELNTWSAKVLAKIMTLPGIIDVNTDQLNNGLQAYVNVDRDTASRFGLTSQLIDQTLYDAFGQNQISTLYTALNQYHVVMEVAPEYWQNPITLKQIYVKSPNGADVPLSAFATFSALSTLLSVNHQGQSAAATISFNLKPKFAIGDAVKTINNAVNSMQLPVSIQSAFQGSAQAFQASLANEPYLILAALFSVYIVLGILYESLIHPITILSTLPSAGVGALLALLITRTEFSIIALIGMILLIGIVKKNAIMMIDFALHAQRSENKSPQEAIYEAALLRFRPIMMTTMAAMLGAFPLALGRGIGAELRHPLGITIIGGLLVSQMLTLYTTPVIYLTMERYSQWWNNAFTIFNRKRQADF